MRALRAAGFAAALSALAGGSLAADPERVTGQVVVPSGAAAIYRAGPPDLPDGTQIGMISGGPAAVGPFVPRVTAPADAVIAPHARARPEALTIFAGSVSSARPTVSTARRWTARGAAS